MKSSMSKSTVRVARLVANYCLLPALLGALLGSTPLAASESILIGAGDQLHIQVADTPEMDQHPRVTDAGEVPIEGVGNVQVAGLTPAAAAVVLQNRLIAARYMRHPIVLVTIEQFATQTVSVLGEVKAPGAYTIATPRSILNVLALAGGLNSAADRNIVIERHGDPATRVHYKYSNNPDTAVEEQVFVSPGDTVLVPKAGIVYILGDVNRPGGYSMTNNESKMTMLEALALAGGVSKSAKQGAARLIRKDGSGSYADQKFSVGDLQEGKIPDIAMQPGDVVYIPFSFGRNMAVMGAGSIAASATSAAIYALP
jgi:polysaccharide export outer membrane protein